MARIKSLKKSKRSFKKRFYGKRSSRKSSNKLRKRSSRKSRKSLKKKSKKMKVRTNRKIGGKKKQQLGGELEGDDLKKLNLLYPPFNSTYGMVKRLGTERLNSELESYGFSTDATVEGIRDRNAAVVEELKKSITGAGNEKLEILTSSELFQFINIYENAFVKIKFATQDLSKLGNIKSGEFGKIIISDQLSRPQFGSLSGTYIMDYGFKSNDGLDEIEAVNMNIKRTLGGLAGGATTVEELSEVVGKIIGGDYTIRNYKQYGTNLDDDDEDGKFEVLNEKVTELKDLGKEFGISDSDLTLFEIEKSKGTYGFPTTDGPDIIGEVNANIKGALGGPAGNATTVEQLSGVLGGLIGTGYETSDYKNYGTEGTPENTTLKGIIKSKIDNEKKQMEFEKFKNEEITVYYAEIKNSDSFPGEIPAYTEITLTSKQVKRSGLVGKGYIRVEDGNIEGGGNISVSTLFGKGVNTISDIKIENWGPGAITFSRHLEESAILLPQLSVGHVILFKNETPGRLLSKGKVEYRYASVTSVGEGGSLMKVHNGDEGVTIPEVYVKIEGMGPDQIKSSAELNAEATAEADRVAADEGKLSADIQKLRNEIAAIVGFTITSRYIGGTNFVSGIQSYGFGKDPALNSQPKKPTTEYRDELTALKLTIEARNADVKVAYKIDGKVINTKDIYNKITELEKLYSGYGLNKMDQGNYADFTLTGVKAVLVAAEKAQQVAAEKAQQVAAEATEAERVAAEKAQREAVEAERVAKAAARAETQANQVGVVSDTNPVGVEAGQPVVDSGRDSPVSLTGSFNEGDNQGQTILAGADAVPVNQGDTDATRSIGARGEDDAENRGSVAALESNAGIQGVSPVTSVRTASGHVPSIPRSTRVSPGTSTPSQSVSEALDNIIQALGKKKKQGSDA